MTQQQKKLLKILKKWIVYFGLEHWRIGIHFKGVSDEPEDSDASEPAMRVTTNWPYQNATIDVFEDSIRFDSDSSLNEYAAHEMTHIVLAMFRDTKRHSSASVDAEEQVATQVARTLVRVVKDLEREHERDIDKLCKAADAAIEGKPAAYEKLRRKFVGR